MSRIKVVVPAPPGAAGGLTVGRGTRLLVGDGDCMHEVTGLESLTFTTIVCPDEVVRTTLVLSVAAPVEVEVLEEN